ncbi:uncharacterized protein [Phaseolus vulgaris]|uniref:uncharacterized protein n=1 Tax=Phaseolus vulgaris TaxID=3885 RepID=UPI0035CB8F58
MWEVLEVTHEGTEDVKRSRKHSLIQEYELFRMQPEESIADVQKRFTHIVNHLIGLGKEFDREELNIKVLKCLDRSWQPKGTSKWIVQTINQRTNLPARKLKGARGEELTFLGNRMKYLQPVALQSMKDEGSISNSVSDFSMEYDNYDQLLAAFKETHDEANRLAVICNKLQKVNNVFAPKVKTLEEELHKAKTDLKGSKRNQWYLDSGCSKHMTGDLTKFTSLKFKAEGHVTYGENNHGRILGRGTVGTGNSTTIENVFYVEGLKHSLLNINQLCDKGYKVNFKSNGCTISSDPSGKVLFTGKRVNNI